MTSEEAKSCMLCCHKSICHHWQVVRGVVLDEAFPIKLPGRQKNTLADMGVVMGSNCQSHEPRQSRVRWYIASSKVFDDGGKKTGYLNSAKMEWVLTRELATAFLDEQTALSVGTQLLTSGQWTVVEALS